MKRLLLLLPLVFVQLPAAASPKSNLLVICTDVLGHGDVAPCKGPPGWGKGGDQLQSVPLYNLVYDLGGTKNLATAMPEKVAEMKALLGKLLTVGRSAPVAPQNNDVEVGR